MPKVKEVKKTKKVKKVELPMLLKKAPVHDYCKEMGLGSGAEFYEALNVRVAREIKDAAKRAEQNGRKTLKKRDI